MDYKQIASAIECDVDDIQERCKYLIEQLEESKQHIPDSDSGSELEYAIGDVQNLLSLIFFDYTEHQNKVA